MTREDAIAFFRDMNECTYGNLEALDMAIEALKQEPCADCVSRQVMLDALEKWWNCKTEEDDIYEIIKTMPPVTPAPKMGHWEYVQYDGNPNIGNWHCSECRSIVEYKPTYNWEKKPYHKYCYNCGAKMEVDNADSD